MRKILLIAVTIAVVAFGAAGVHRLIGVSRCQTTLLHVTTIAQLCELIRPADTTPAGLVAAAKAAGSVLPSDYLVDGWEHPIQIVSHNAADGSRAYEIFACGEEWPCTPADAPFYFASGRWVRSLSNVGW